MNEESLKAVERPELEKGAPLSGWLVARAGVRAARCVVMWRGAPPLVRQEDTNSPFVRRQTAAQQWRYQLRSLQ